MSQTGPTDTTAGAASKPPAVVPLNSSVVVEGVDPALIAFILRLGEIHLALFGMPLTITSGKDGQHAPGSLHSEGKALDLRISDLEEAKGVLFLTIIMTFAVEWDCRVFDERVGPGGPHVHIEYHGE